ncbi:hypothetical protein [Flavobacterium sp. 3HN19-14]|uniref:hypothetical protein n=1 Tax=Flavobacterium sp. 3HN19-14 TaxID=3448133 RepID=UPI003EDE8D12
MNGNFLVYVNSNGIRKCVDLVVSGNDLQAKVPDDQFFILAIFYNCKRVIFPSLTNAEIDCAYSGNFNYSISSFPSRPMIFNFHRSDIVYLDTPVPVVQPPLYTNPVFCRRTFEAKIRVSINDAEKWVVQDYDPNSGTWAPDSIYSPYVNKDSHEPIKLAGLYFSVEGHGISLSLADNKAIVINPLTNEFFLNAAEFNVIPIGEGKPHVQISDDGGYLVLSTIPLFN